jgi:PPK2 family polyphosphate:nucleotide phosphotransferase
MTAKTGKRDELAECWRLPHGKPVRLSRLEPGATKCVKDRDAATRELARIQERLVHLQNVLYAQSKHAVLVVLQAMDTGGKDGTIRRVFGPLNPQGVRVISFKAPTEEELSHDYLWRIHRATPARGMIHIFNRSHYEDVLAVRVRGLAPRKEVERRYEQINVFEKHLADNGTTIVKLFLHISRGEQKERLQARLDDPRKHWKFRVGDLDDRKLWPHYTRAYELALSRCNTRWAPWYAVPADHKWYRDLVVASILQHALKGLKLKYPPSEPGLDKVRIPD